MYPPCSILILGCYGNVGRRITQLLLETSSYHLVLVGKNHQRLVELVDTLKVMKGYFPKRISIYCFDMFDLNLLNNIIKQVNLVLVTASISSVFLQIAELSMANNCHYIDLWYSPAISLLFKQKFSQNYQSKSIILTQAGLQPGLPALLARFLLDTIRKDEIVYIKIASFIKVDWEQLALSKSTLIEIREHFQPLIYKNGVWKSFNTILPCYQLFDFGENIGFKYCKPVYLEEIAELVLLLSNIRSAGFYVEEHYACSFPPPHLTRMKVVIDKVIDKRLRRQSLWITHQDSLFITAASVIASIKQVLAERQIPPGYHISAMVLDPIQFVKDLQDLGIVVEKLP